MIKRILLSLVLVYSSVAGGQSVTQLPRSSPADSTLFLCSDSTKTVTRACKFSDVQKRLAFKTFDSLVTSTLRATGAITVGSCVGCGGGVTYPLAATDGSAAAPSIAFANSTGTGLYRFNADTLGFATAGLLRATLSASGSGASFRASGAGNLVLGPGTGNGRAVTVQGTSATGVLTSYLQVDRTAVSALNGAIFQGAGTAAAPMFSVQNGGGGGLGMYSPTIDTVAFSSLSAYTLGISGGAAAHLTGGTGNMTIQAGTGASRTLTLQTTNNASAATTFISGSGDTLKTTHIIASGLTAASGTPNSLCLVSATKQVTENAATSCVVSSIRFKTNVKPLSLDTAQMIVQRLTPVTYDMKDGGRHSLHVIAEQADSISKRLSFYDDKGRVNSVDDGAILSAVLLVVQDQQRQIALLHQASITLALICLLIIVIVALVFINRKRS